MTLPERRSGNLLKRVHDWMGGKSIAFATFFALCGTLLAFLHKLDLSYSALVTSILPFVVVRSIAQDRLPPITPAQSLHPEKKGADVKVEVTEKKEGPTP